jgi:hypothetical protein
MKKFDLVHTTILIVAILCGYSALRLVLDMLTGLFLIAGMYGTSTLPFISANLIQAVIYFIACIILIRKGRTYATAILRIGPAEKPSEDDSVEWQLDRRNILFVLFIGLGLYSLIEAIPPVLTQAYALFKDRISTRFCKTAGRGFHCHRSPPGRDLSVTHIRSSCIDKFH